MANSIRNCHNYGDTVYMSSQVAERPDLGNPNIYLWKRKLLIATAGSHPSIEAELLRV